MLWHFRVSFFTPPSSAVMPYCQCVYTLIFGFTLSQQLSDGKYTCSLCLNYSSKSSHRYNNALLSRTPVHSHSCKFSLFGSISIPDISIAKQLDSVGSHSFLIGRIILNFLSKRFEESYPRRTLGFRQISLFYKLNTMCILYPLVSCSGLHTSVLHANL